MDHSGCSGSFENGKQVVDKVRAMGFSQQFMPVPIEIECDECGGTFTMDTFEKACPKCGMIYGVTPCHAFDRTNIKKAGKNY